MRSILILIVAAAIANADAKPGDVGTPEHKKASELVKQLGHARYPTREAAAKQLIEMGPAAVVALNEGIKSTDEEVRNRSIALLPQAKAAEWKRRAAAYLADTENKQKHELPLLSDWEKLVGKPEAGSRKLFAEMVRTNGELLEQVAADRKKASSACSARCKIVLAQVRTAKGQIKAEVGDLAAILFVDTLAPIRTDWSAQTFPAYLLSNPMLAESMDANDLGPALRRLLAAWVDVRPAQDTIALQKFASFAQKKPFPEAAKVLVKMVKDKTADVLSVRLVCVQALGKVGGKEAAAALAELVPDTSPIFGGGMNEYQIGDAALAASITMHGRKLTDFGMNHNGGIGFGSPDGDEPISINLYGFSNADGREKAVKKWREEIVAKKEKKDETPSKK